MHTRRSLLDNLQSFIEALEDEIRLKNSRIKEQEEQISALKSELWNTQLQVPSRPDYRNQKIRVRLPPAAPINFQTGSDIPSRPGDPTPSLKACEGQSSSSGLGEWKLSNSPLVFTNVSSAKLEAKLEAPLDPTPEPMPDPVPDLISDSVLGSVPDSEPSPTLDEYPVVDPIQNHAKEAVNYVYSINYPDDPCISYRNTIKPRSLIKRLKKDVISQNGLQTFTLFPELPLELQQRIWQFALLHQGRILEFCHILKNTGRSYQKVCPLPVAFQVCRISREEATRAYQPLLYTRTLKIDGLKDFSNDGFVIAEAYMDFNNDTLLLTQREDLLYLSRRERSGYFEFAKIRRLAIKMDIWDSTIPTWPMILAKMTGLKTITIVWVLTGSQPFWDLLRAHHALGTLNAMLKENPTLAKMIPEIKFGVLSGNFGAEKKYSAVIHELPTSIVRMEKSLENV